MSGRPPSSSARFSAGTSVRWPAARVDIPDDVDVVDDGEGRRLLRRLEKRPDVDVEAEIREGRRDHLLAAVMAVLAELGDEDAGRAAGIRFELGDHMRATSATASLRSPISCR